MSYSMDPRDVDASGSEARVDMPTPIAGQERGRPRLRDTPVSARGPRLTARDWSFMPGRRNRRRRRNLARRISYSDEGEVDVLPEINKKATGLRWKPREARKLKFVDDGTMVAKLNMESGECVGRDGGRELRRKEDLQTQNMFRRVVRKAESRGMVVNNGKTKILCISDAMRYTAQGSFKDSDGVEMVSGSILKVLGFHMDTRPSCHAHVEALKRRVREVTWVLRHLRHAGFREDMLARVYKTIIRPVLDYCAVVYHPMLTP